MDTDRCTAPALAPSAKGAPTRFEVSRGAHFTLVRAAGEVDSATADEFAATIRERFQPGGRVAVDLGGVTFMSACGVNACLRVQREGRAGGCDVAFAGARGIVGRVLEILEVEPTLSGWIGRP
jgi:anti-anti-sigma factor